MLFKSLRTLLLAGLVSSLPEPLVTPTKDPRAHINNGTYVGRYLPEYDQDLFLGVAFAQPPVVAVPQPSILKYHLER